MDWKNISYSLSLLSQKSPKEIQNALILIRTNFTKDKQSVDSLVKHNAIPKFLCLLQQASQVGEVHSEQATKTTDLVLSILGNICMEPNVRKHVQRNGGISILERCLRDSTTESIQNRCCRTLANLALEIGCCRLIQQTDVVPTTVRLLEHTENQDCQKTYCRALRLFGHMNELQKKIVESNGISTLAKLFKSPDGQIILTALKTLAELANIRCCADFARQVLSGDILDDLVQMVADEDQMTSHRALSILFHLTQQPNVRPAIGSAGGILCYKDLLKGNVPHVSKTQVLNALCLCSHEAVNRVRLREAGILEVLVVSLWEEDFSNLHNRIISALINFLYDEPSFDILLEKGLVPVLLFHLQRCAGFSFTVHPHPAPLALICSILNDPCDENDSERMRLNFGGSCNKDEDNLGDKSQASVKNAGTTEKLDEEILSEACNTADESISCNSHIFRIDSPTYENTTWNLNDFTDGTTCKQTFSYELSNYPSSPTSTLSPLSNSSYHSPDWSPQFSPPQSPQSFSSEFSYTTDVSPGYSSSHSFYSEKSSPSSLIEPKDIPEEKDEHDSGSSEVTSPSNLDSTLSTRNEASYENENKDYLEATPCLDKAEKTKEAITVTGILGRVDIEERKLRNEDFKETCQSESIYGDNGKSSTPSTDKSASVKSTSVSDWYDKRKAMIEKQSYDALKKTEDNILILLSRVSQIEDPSKYLATFDSFLCLLEYLSSVPFPLPRSIRILSRIVRNPFCFERLVGFMAPVMIYLKLMIRYNGKERETSGIATADTFTAHQTPPHKKKSQEELVLACTPSPSSASNINLGSGLSIDSLVQNYQGLYKAGQSILNDLSFVVETHFGQSLLVQKLMKKAEAEQQLLAVCLPFLCRSKRVQEKLLVNLRGLDMVLDVIKQQVGMGLSKVGILGLGYLARHIGIETELETVIKQHVFPQLDNCDSKTSELQVVCHIHCAPHDVSFVTESGENISASKKTLIAKSEMFAAMLAGHYVEAKQSEIKIVDTSHEALEYILHYLHGCNLKCPILKKMEMEASDAMLSIFLDVLVLVDRYMIADLHYYLSCVLCQNYLSPNCVHIIFGFSLLYNYRVLSMDCIRYVLVKIFSGRDAVRSFLQMMEGLNGNTFFQEVTGMLKGKITN